MSDSEETYYVIEIGFDIFGRENKRIYNSYSKKEEAEDVADRLNASNFNWGETYFIVMSAKNYLKKQGGTMMKIKVKKEIKLLELFEYIKKNEIADKVFFDNKGKGKVVVGDDRYLYMTDLNLTDTFTVEVEEELNMETDIPVLIELNRGEFHFHYDSFLRGEKNCNSDAFYILNNDMTMTLLWTRNGGLVE